MKIHWAQADKNTWYGRAPQLQFCMTITYSDFYDMFFVEEAKNCYGSIRSAKIAAAKLAPSIIAEQGMLADRK